MILGGSSGDSRARTMQVYLAVSQSIPRALLKLSSSQSVNPLIIRTVDQNTIVLDEVEDNMADYFPADLGADL